jgi:hypothetical protein
MSRNEALARTARYEGKYRPAWRIIQIGVRSTGCRRHARRNRCSFDPDIAHILYGHPMNRARAAVLDFSQAAVGTTDNQIRAHRALPGGVIYDSRSPHHRDLLEQGESRWIFE